MVEKSFNMGARKELNAIIARMFHSSGLSFNFARNPYYAMAFTYAANNPISGYIPHSIQLVEDPLLQNEKANIERILEPIKSTWRLKGVSLCSDE